MIWENSQILLNISSGIWAVVSIKVHLLMFHDFDRRLELYTIKREFQVQSHICNQLSPPWYWYDNYQILNQKFNSQLVLKLFSRQHDFSYAYFVKLIWNFKICIVVFICFQPVIPNLYKTILWRLGVPNYKHQYNDLLPVSNHPRTRQLNAIWQQSV